MPSYLLSSIGVSRILWGFAAAVITVPSALASDLPPDYLINENCRKAEAIVEGRIVDSTTLPNAFTQTQLRVTRIYRGPFRAGDVVTYASFRESAQRSQAELTRELIVFLVSRVGTADARRWGTSIDFSEFPSSAALQAKVRNCRRRK